MSFQSTAEDSATVPKEQPLNNSKMTEVGGGDVASEIKNTLDTSNQKIMDKPKKKVRSKRQPNKSAEIGNELSHIIPGYTAPMRLEAKSLQGITGASLSELRKRASTRGNSSTMYAPSISILNKSSDTKTTFDPAAASKKVKTPSSLAIQKSSNGGNVRKIPTSFSSSFRKTRRKQHDNTAGSGWFNMTPTPMSSQLKTDLAIIRNRNYLDPKKFYKSTDKFDGKILQVGTVIEGSAEYYSSRLVKKDRRQNLTEEIMADSTVSSYAKRKYHEIQSERAKPQKRKGGKRGRGRR